MKILASLFTVILASSTAVAASYPALASYETLAQEALAGARVASTEQELKALQVLNRELVASGVEIMELYAEKNPICQAQFDVMIPELATLESMTVAELHDRYHDGKGLPAAPRHCYFGRSQVVHPAMNVVRLNSAWTEVTRDEVVDELEEVIEHLERIQKNLDNPPQ